MKRQGGSKESERRSDTETGMVRRETERRLNDEKQERQLKPFDSTRINRRETKTSKAGRINAIKESDNLETRSTRIEPKRRSNDGAFGRELETFGNTRIVRRMVKTRLLERTSEQFRNAIKESERKSDTETGMVTYLWLGVKLKEDQMMKNRKGN